MEVKLKKERDDAAPDQVATPAKKTTSLEYQRERDREPVRGIFRFYELPGGHVEFCFKKYKQDQVENYSLYDGQQYTLPLGVAKHLNGDCWYPIHAHTMGTNDLPAVRINEKVHRMGFQSLEFIDIEDLPQPGKSVITVQHL